MDTIRFLKTFQKGTCLNLTPLIFKTRRDITTARLDEITKWENADGYLTCSSEATAAPLLEGATKNYGIRIPRGVIATLKVSGLVAIWTPKLAPALGGIRLEGVMRVYPQIGNILYMESNEIHYPIIEQNLAEDYHHVIWEFGEGHQPQQVDEIAALKARIATLEATKNDDSNLRGN